MIPACGLWKCIFSAQGVPDSGLKGDEGTQGHASQMPPHLEAGSVTTALSGAHTHFALSGLFVSQ